MMKIGMSRTVSAKVNEGNTAAAVGSGDTRVFATPMMVALMANAASTLAVGMTVEATATLTSVEGRTLTFSMEARDEHGVIGTGVQKRAVVLRDRFVEKAYSKLEK